MRDDLLKPFADAVDGSTDYFRRAAASGKKIIGYFCSYTPVEIIHAAGFIPARINGGPGPVEKANAHVPDFICPYMKRGLENALNGKYDYLSGLVQGYTCDAACGTVNIWKDAIDLELVHTLPLPYNQTEGAGNFFSAAVRELATRLNNCGGTYSDSALARSIALYGRTYDILWRFYEMRMHDELSFSAADFNTIVSAEDALSPEDYLEALESLAGHMRNTFVQVDKRPRVLVSGSLVEENAIFALIESCGARIVADDLCTGLRRYFPEYGNQKDPVKRLFHRHIHRLPCPSRSRAADRGAMIADLMEISGAKSAIFVVQKFCTPHLADFPALSDELKRRGWPSLLLEVDETWQAEGQLKNRLESFLEMMAPSAGNS